MGSPRLRLRIKGKRWDLGPPAHRLTESQAGCRSLIIAYTHGRADLLTLDDVKQIVTLTRRIATGQKWLDWNHLPQQLAALLKDASLAPTLEPYIQLCNPEGVTP